MNDKDNLSPALSGNKRFKMKSDMPLARIRRDLQIYILGCMIIPGVMGLAFTVNAAEIATIMNMTTGSVLMFGLGGLFIAIVLAYLLFAPRASEFILDDSGFTLTYTAGRKPILSYSRIAFADIEGIAYFYSTFPDMPLHPLTYEEFMQSTPEELRFRGAMLATRSGKDVSIGGTDYAPHEIKEIMAILEQRLRSTREAAYSAPRRAAKHSPGDKKRMADLFLSWLAIPMAVILAIVAGNWFGMHQVHKTLSQSMPFIGGSIVVGAILIGLFVWLTWGFISTVTWAGLDFRHMFSQAGLTLFMLALPVMLLGIFFMVRNTEQPVAKQDLLPSAMPQQFEQNNTDPGPTPLVQAVNERNLVEVRRLLKQGADPNEGRLAGESALTLAFQQKDKQLIQLLLAARADPNYRNPKYTNTELPLQTAIKWKSKDMISMLLKAGADINRTDGVDRTPLMTALGRFEIKWPETEEIVKLLVRKNADVNAGGSRLDTPLILVVVAKKASLVTLFIEKGVDVDRQGTRGWTPLMTAAAQGDLEIVQALLKAKARVDIKSDEGITALGMAEYKANNVDLKVVELLKAAGAR